MAKTAIVTIGSEDPFPKGLKYALQAYSAVKSRGHYTLLAEAYLNSSLRNTDLDKISRGIRVRGLFQVAQEMEGAGLLEIRNREQGFEGLEYICTEMGRLFIQHTIGLAKVVGLLGWSHDISLAAKELGFSEEEKINLENMGKEYFEGSDK